MRVWSTEALSLSVGESFSATRALLPGYARSCGATYGAIPLVAEKWDRRSSPRPISTAQLKESPSYTRGLSTRWSLWGLTRLSGGRSYLGVGFALRCFQRLSHPDMATQRCSWQNNWCTSGPSNPVLSY